MRDTVLLIMRLRVIMFGKICECLHIFIIVVVLLFISYCTKGEVNSFVISRKVQLFVWMK